MDQAGRVCELVARAPPPPLEGVVCPNRATHTPVLTLGARKGTSSTRARCAWGTGGL
jgi:hypothetical protein